MWFFLKYSEQFKENYAFLFLNLVKILVIFELNLILFGYTFSGGFAGFSTAS